jgi:hypothetical protein
MLTEVVAAVLRNAPELALEWLRAIGATELHVADAVEVSTQVRYAQLAGHEADSRVDLVIRLSGGGRREVIFVESKVGSGQGYQQLQRYAELLAVECARAPGAQGCLVFVTRDFEPCKKPAVPEFAFRFRATRWFEVYRMLKARRNGDGLEKQLLLFMKENHMSNGNTFRSVDLVALENFLSAKALMDQTLEELPEQAAKLRGIMSSQTKAMGELRKWSRYVRFIDYKSIFLMVGYWLPSEDPDEPVWAGVAMQSNPGGPARNEVIAAFKGWIAKETPGREGDELDVSSSWSAIHKGVSLNTLLSTKDDVAALKAHFDALLDEVESFQRAYPTLPWAGVEPGEGE